MITIKDLTSVIKYILLNWGNIKLLDHERKQSSRFRRIFLVAFLLFLDSAVGYYPAGPNS